MKPTVTYTDALGLPRVGDRMIVQALDHPRFHAGAWIHTGTVLFANGERFMTKHTAYIPALRDGDDLKLRDARLSDDATKRTNTT